MTDLADATRLTLSQRIHRFVLVLERFKRNPNRREAYHVLSAIEALREGRYEAGLQCIRAAELVSPIPEGLALLPGLHDDMTAGELRRALRALVRPVEADIPASGMAEAATPEAAGGDVSS
jgi:hypothetical protein